MPTLTTIDGTWVNNPSTPEFPNGDPALLLDAGELRRADAAIFSSGGVAKGLSVSVSASDEVTVQPGVGVIDGDSVVAGTGVYRVGLGAAAVGQLTGRDATYGRVDRVVLRQLDPDVVPAHTERKARVEVLDGDPSATPTAPALPALAIHLGSLEVPVQGGGPVTVDVSGVQRARVIDTSTITKAKKAAQGTNSSSLVDDNDLWFDAIAGERYVLEFDLLASVTGGSSTSDIKFNLGLPGGGSFNLGGIGPASTAGSGATEGDAAWNAIVSAQSASLVFGLTGSACYIRLHGYFTAAASGRARLRWAQNSTIGAVTTSLLAGSTMKARTVA